MNQINFLERDLKMPSGFGFFVAIKLLQSSINFLYESDKLYCPELSNSSFFCSYKGSEIVDNLKTVEVLFAAIYDNLKYSLSCIYYF